MIITAGGKKDTFYKDLLLRTVLEVELKKDKKKKKKKV